LRPWLLRVLAAFTIAAIISPAILFSGVPASGFSLFYLWATLYSFYFFSAPEAALQTLVVALSYGAVLVLGRRGELWGEEATRWGMTVGTVLVSGGLVRLLTEGVRRSEDRYRRVFAANPRPMWVVDRPTLRYLDVNQAAIDCYGYSREEFLAMTLRDLRPPEDIPELERAVAADDTGADRRKVWRHRKRDGTLIDVEVVATELPFDDRDLRLVLATDVTERLRAERQLRHQADHDVLTGLYNRRRFEEEVGRGVAAAAARRGPCAVLVLDVDHLKYVNDSFGHAAGDAVLRRLGAGLSRRLPAEASAARVAGDEFAILLPGADREAAVEVAAGLLDYLRGTVWHGLRRTTASIGVACFDSEHCATPHELLVAADIAMHEAKDAGRDRFVVSAAPKGGLTWVEEVRQAIDDRRLVLYTQPILDLRSGEIAQEELLVRIRDREGEIVPPAAFIPTAERFGLIHEIDRWVTARGVELARAGRRVEVNLSAHSIGDRELTRIVDEGMGAGDDAENLVFEITETAAAANFDEARDFAERLRRLGCGFALDDFGTGFGSFSYLKHVPATYLKIDMEFVRELARNPADQRVVKAIVSIAEGFGQRTIAEGVEDELTLELLRRYGVHYAQGFLIGRPHPLDPAAPPVRASAHRAA
jgi:diguanylate cyclase (GGDEF)-like protein/PAS domain S-box-containing protein